MTQYEYQVIKTITQSSQEDAEMFHRSVLNAEGENGWKLVQVVVKEYTYIYVQHTYYFIREKQK